MTSLTQLTYDHVRKLTLNEPTGHDWWHTLRVYTMALRLAKQDFMYVDTEIISLAALLHDIKDYKLTGGDEEAGPKAAQEWLSANGASDSLIEHVVSIIRDLSFKGKVDRPMKTREGMIVQDADRLDAVGAIGIARTFAYGGANGREIFNPDIPARKDLSPKDYKDRTQPSPTLNHFFEKLLLLDGHYHTALANEIGHQRHLYLIEYVETLLKECDALDGTHAEMLKNLKK